MCLQVVSRLLLGGTDAKRVTVDGKNALNVAANAGGSNFRKSVPRTSTP
jgi:hypothetical protein